MTPKETAEWNLNACRINPYLGRGLILGVTPSGRHLVQTYFIMGRSEGSRNRVLCREGGRLFTKSADQSRESGNPDLTMYDAMSEAGGNYVVSNGRQTTKVIVELNCGENFSRTLSSWKHEPDSISTPRITGVWSLYGNRGPLAKICVIRKSRWGDSSDRLFFEFEHIEPGFVFCVTTYTGDGNPPPTFCGEPWLLPVQETPEENLQTYWDVLNLENRVSLGVKMIEISTGESTVSVINQYQKV